jgi:hypothetical protein
MIRIGVINAPPPTPVMPTKRPTAKPDSEYSGSIIGMTSSRQAAADLSIASLGSHRDEMVERPVCQGCSAQFSEICGMAPQPKNTYLVR